VLILDEPTAALAKNERDELFALIRRLLARGTAVLLVTHHLHEFEELAHHVTVLRNGVVAAELAGAAITIPAMIRAMLDRDLADQFPDLEHRPGKRTVLEATLSHARLPGGVQLSVREGEILGVAGLLGAGKTEVARSLLGLEGTATVRADGRELHIADPRRAMLAGILLVPEERKAQAVVGDLSVYDNGVLSYVAGSSPERTGPRLLPRRAPIRERFAEMVSAVGVRFAQDSQPASGLSGGNQQKLVISRALACSPRLLVLDEPTRGVDVGSRRDIYELVVEQARRGLGVILMSSDTREVHSLAHRVLVLQGGEVAHEITDPRGMSHEEFAARLSPPSNAVNFLDPEVHR
jgi:ABC-type sugar transport system ATPase subunit